MAKVIFGNHSSVLVPRQDRDNIRKFYCDVLGGKIMKVDPERGFVRLGTTSTSGFSMEMSLMRASSYGVPVQSGWKSSLTTWRK
jgi:hypothetical protein